MALQSKNLNKYRPTRAALVCWTLMGLVAPVTVHAQFVGEVACGGWNFCPNGWADCNGQILAISEYDVLFNLIGTTYGGDGQQTFALPNIQSRTMVHTGTGPSLTTRQLAKTGGAENVTLATNQIPSHSHPLAAYTGNERSASPTGRMPGIAPAAAPVYAASGSLVGLNSNAISMTGGSQPHNNLQPYLAVKCCISLFGVFPSQP